MPQFRVQYARTVIMEHVVTADSIDDVHDDGNLPGVYQNDDGSQMTAPGHVRNIVDDENIWSVRPL